MDMDSYDSFLFFNELLTTTLSQRLKLRDKSLIKGLAISRKIEITNSFNRRWVCQALNHFRDFRWINDALRPVSTGAVAKIKTHRDECGSWITRSKIVARRKPRERGWWKRFGNNGDYWHRWADIRICESSAARKDCCRVRGCQWLLLLIVWTLRARLPAAANKEWIRGFDQLEQRVYFLCIFGSDGL